MKFLKEYIDYIKDNPNHYWFKRKLYGWGWTPVTWQGWLVVGLLLVGIFFDAFYYLEKGKVIEYVVVLTLLLLATFFITYKKGEKPKWQWGPPKEKDKE